MNISFIGLGIMGSRMAGNLLKNNIPLKVFNRSSAPVNRLEKKGAHAAASYKDAVTDADIVFTMLASPEAVQEAALSVDGFISSMKENALWIDCSTVNPSFTMQAHAHAEARSIRFMDAPVAGSKPQAENGELIFFAGGDKQAVESVEHLLTFMGNRVIHAGETGRGACFKMLVNALLAQSMAAFAETVLLGEKMGFSKDFLLDILPNLAVSAPFTIAKSEKIRNDEYDVQFPLELMHKDLHLISETARENGQPLFLANLVKELFAGALKNGLGREDFSAIYKHLNQ